MFIGNKDISKVAVIGAMECEINEIKSLLTNIKEVSYADLKVWLGNIGTVSIILTQSGMGKVNAAINTQYIIDTFKPDFIINTGVAGGLQKGLKIGDLVIGESLVQHDFDVTFLGYAKGYMFKGEQKDKPTKYYGSKDGIKIFEEAVAENMPNVKTFKGVIASGDIFVSDKKLKEEINTFFGAAAVEMEGCAIAQTAEKNNVPFVVIRAISDLADGTENEYKVNVEEIAKVAAKSVECFLTFSGNETQIKKR